MINECGAIGGIRIGKVNLSTWRKSTQCHFVHNKLHMVLSVL
jgi:hypothetical protein